MNTPLFHVVSAFVAILVFLVWLRPAQFKVLLDKENNDYPSLGRQGQFTAMIISSWGFVAIILKGDLPEWFYVGYMSIWALAQGGSAWLKLRGKEQNQGSVVTVTEPTPDPSLIKTTITETAPTGRRRK